MNKRKMTKIVKVGDVPIGGGNPIVLQSMTTSQTDNIQNVVAEIQKLEKAGCEVIRSSIPDKTSAEAIPKIKEQIDIPLIADIHFNHELAILAIERGIDKIRINPGNIGKREHIEKVLDKANQANIPIRVGINSGSLEKNLLQKYNHPTPEAMLESAERHIKICEEFGFENLVFSLKSSDARLMIKANRKFSDKYDYPLHLGVTEAGAGWRGMIKSSVGIGTLLAEGIGDTIRVSLTNDPVKEVKAGKQILQSLDLASGLNIISCPTCARTRTNLIDIVKKLEQETEGIEKDLTVAVMGCIVNGPGEAEEADLGIACGDQGGLLFINGEPIEKVPEEKMLDRLVTEIKKYPESK